MAEEFKTKQKVYDMMLYAYPALAQFPKSEKYALATDIKRCMHMLYALCISVEKKYYKKNTLQDMDVELATLQGYIRLAQELTFLPFKKYEYWSGLLVEIGKMLGGLIKAAKQ